MTTTKNQQLAYSHTSENSFSVKPQPVPDEIKNKMEKSAENAARMIKYYNSIYSSSNTDSEKHPVLTKANRQNK